MPSIAGSAGSAARCTDDAPNCAARVSAGQSDGVSAHSSIPGEVSAGPPTLGEALRAARLGDGTASSRGEKLARNDVEDRESKLALQRRQDFVAKHHLDHPGTAPPVEAGQVYCLFPPGSDERFDLANPGRVLRTSCRSYWCNPGLHGFEVKVLLAKRCFEIRNSPPPIPGCANPINKQGTLTIGFGVDTNKAWLLVLQVIDQVRKKGDRALALAPNWFSRASAGKPEETVPEDTPSQVVPAGVRKRQLMRPTALSKARRVVKPEPHVSLANAINHACIGREWVRGDIVLEGEDSAVFVRGGAKMICSLDHPLGECSHCPFVVRAPPGGSEEETDAATANLSKGDEFLAGEGGGHEATSPEMELVSEDDTSGSTDDEHDGPRPGQGSAEKASAGFNPPPRCGIDSRHCLLNVGGHHRGNVVIRKINFPGLLGEWEVIVCEATNEIMNSKLMAEAYNLDPNQQAELFQLQRVCPDAIPGYESTSEDEDDGRLRLQPCTDSMLDNLRPRGSRYTGSCCKDVLLTLSDAFLMRFAMCEWSWRCEEAYHERMMAGGTPMAAGRFPFIIECRWARQREQKLAYRNECIRNMHHARLRCVEMMPVARAAIDTVLAEQRDEMDRANAEADIFRGSSADTVNHLILARMDAEKAERKRLWAIEDQKDILESEKWKRRYAASSAGHAAAGLGRGVDCNGLSPRPSRSEPIDAATASGSDAAAHASSRELHELQKQLLDACNTATVVASLSSQQTTTAGALLSSTATYVHFCEYVRRIALGVLRDDQDGNAI